ncbi:MAG: hypothetical protein AVDCRST_MAG40-3327, partial [uncultured Gemmatimonadaceae bacterium]
CQPPARAPRSRSDSSPRRPPPARSSASGWDRTAPWRPSRCSAASRSASRKTREPPRNAAPRWSGSGCTRRSPRSGAPCSSSCWGASADSASPWPPRSTPCSSTPWTRGSSRPCCASVTGRASSRHKVRFCTSSWPLRSGSVRGLPLVRVEGG